MVLLYGILAVVMVGEYAFLNNNQQTAMQLPQLQPSVYPSHVYPSQSASVLPSVLSGRQEGVSQGGAGSSSQACTNLPSELVFTVSEHKADVQSFDLFCLSYVGAPIFRTDGIIGVSATVDYGNVFSPYGTGVVVNVENYPSQQRIPFDELEGQLVITLSSYLTETHRIPLKIRVVHEAQGNSVVGAPSLSVEQVRNILAHYDSPALGSERCFFDLSWQYQIDVAYLLAFFMQESTMGTDSRDVCWPLSETRALGHICYTARGDYCRGSETFCSGRCGTFCSYSSWCDAAEHWYYYVKNRFVETPPEVSCRQNPCDTPEEIIPIYSATDVEAYIANVKANVAKWRRGEL